MATKKTQTKFDPKNIKQPVLKTKKSMNLNQESNVLNDLQMPNVEDFTNLSFEEQNAAYTAIKEVFANLRERQDFMEEEDFQQAYVAVFVELLNLAVTGNVAAQDYLCYVYKKGIDGILHPNLTLAHKWGMLAIANGSKLSIERMRMFLNPVFEFVDDSSINQEEIAENYDIDIDDVFCFVAQTFAGMYNPKMNITPLALAQENPGSIESNFTKFNIESCKKRDEILPELKKYLS